MSKVGHGENTDISEGQLEVKRRLAVLASACALLAVSVAYLLLSSHDLEVLIAPGASLTPEWKELRPGRTMDTSGDCSELFIEILDVHEGADGNYAFADGSKLSVEGFLVSSFGERLNLGVDASVGGFGVTNVLRLSNPALQWKQQDYSFQSLFLRANRPLKVGRIVWISYDPQSTKSGTKEPRAFSEDP